MDLLKVGPGNLLGEEDIAEINRLRFSVSVKCVSQTGILLALPKYQFCKLQSQTQVWETLLNLNKIKIDKYKFQLDKMKSSKNLMNRRLKDIYVKNEMSNNLKKQSSLIFNDESQ